MSHPALSLLSLECLLTYPSFHKCSSDPRFSLGKPSFPHTASFRKEGCPCTPDLCSLLPEPTLPAHTPFLFLGVPAAHHPFLPVKSCPTSRSKFYPISFKKLSLLHNCPPTSSCSWPIILCSVSTWQHLPPSAPWVYLKFLPSSHTLHITNH